MASAEKHHTPELPAFDKPVKLLIVVSPCNKDIADNLVSGAKQAIDNAGGRYDLVEMPRVLEIPSAVAIAERISNFDGYVALGCVMDDLVVYGEVMRALGQLGLAGICVGNGILTGEVMAEVMAENLNEPSQCGLNKGADAAIAALHLVALSRKWGRETKGIGFKPASGEFLMADNPNNGPKIA